MRKFIILPVLMGLGAVCVLDKKWWGSVCVSGLLGFTPYLTGLIG